MKNYLVIGLGNPGSKYANTRHNLGFLVVSRLAEKWGLKFKEESAFKGRLAQGQIGERAALLFLPTTYMNRSGEAVRKVVDYFKIPFADENFFLVVVDDVYIPFGSERLRVRGGAGGHNGLKSIEEALSTQWYPRLRIGIGPKLEEEQPLEDYVLGTFTKEESEKLPEIIEQGVKTIEEWLTLSKKIKEEE